MIVWFILIAFVIFIYFLMKFENIASSTKLIIIMLVFLLFVISVFFWIKNNDVKIDGPKSIINSVVAYTDWIKGIGRSAFVSGKNGVSIIGNAIKGNTTKTYDGRS